MPPLGLRQYLLIGGGIALALLAIALGVQTLRLSWEQTKSAKLAGAIQTMDALSKEADRKWRAVERTWQEQAITITKDRDNEIKAITADRDAALAELRNRPRRPAAGTPENPANGQAAAGCTGARLFRDDAEFLVREAARADVIRAGLRACYAQYDAMKEAQ